VAVRFRDGSFARWHNAPTFPESLFVVEIVPNVRIHRAAGQRCASASGKRYRSCILLCAASNAMSVLVDEPTE